MTDLTLIYTPSVSVLHAHTTDAQAWLDDHLPEDAPRMGDGYACENRYLDPILVALDTAGFTIHLTPGR